MRVARICMVICVCVVLMALAGCSRNYLEASAGIGDTLDPQNASHAGILATLDGMQKAWAEKDAATFLTYYTDDAKIFWTPNYVTYSPEEFARILPTEMKGKFQLKEPLLKGLDGSDATIALTVDYTEGPSFELWTLQLVNGVWKISQTD